MKGPKLLGMLAILILLALAGCQSYCEHRYPCTAYAPAPCCQPVPACQPSYAPTQPTQPLQPIPGYAPAPQGYYPYQQPACACPPAR